MDAIDFLRCQPSNSFDGGLHDPPYSFTMAKRLYDGFGIDKFNSNKRSWTEIKDELARVIKPGGKVICCGWNSNGLGMSRGFMRTHLLVVAHGDGRNDTLVTVEVKK